MSKLTLNENAKEDWLKLVKKHKKKQKGLPALSTLNTDAGNVEHNISMFNKMNSATESPNTNPVSGPFGGDVSSGMAESLTEALKTNSAYMLRNDGKVIFVEGSLNVHPYIMQTVDQKPFSAIRDLFITLEGYPLKWFYDNTNKESTKELIKHFLDALLPIQKHYNITIPEELLTYFNSTPVNFNDEYELINYVETTFEFLNLQTNQEFCRFITSNTITTSKNPSKDVFFRISSVNFNWFDLIWETVYNNRQWIESVTITSDRSAKGQDDIYVIDGTLIKLLPTEDFINLSGNPIVEEYLTKQYDKQFEEGYIEGYYNMYNPVHAIRHSRFMLNELYDNCFKVENIIKEATMNNKEMITLYYPKLNVPDVPTGKVYRGGYYTPDEYETEDVTIEYQYKVSKQDVMEVLQDLDELQEKYWTSSVTPEEFEQLLDDKFDDLLDEFEPEVLKAFEDDAANHAFTYYDFRHYYSESKKSINEKLDDDFDMSLRTLL